MKSYTDMGNEGKSNRFQEEQSHAPGQQFIDNRASIITQNQLIETINSRPKQVVKREQIDDQFGGVDVSSIRQPDSSQEMDKREASKSTGFIQLKKFEAKVSRESEAVDMSHDGSILNGQIYKKLTLGELLKVDDDDKWRSRRGRKSESDERTRWLRALRIGLTDLSGSQVYVWDSAVEEADELETRYIPFALEIHQQFGTLVEEKIEHICSQLGIVRVQNAQVDTVEQAIKYFSWMATIGANLGEIYPNLNGFVQGEIKRLASNPSDEQLNENSVEGMALDRALIEAINKRLSVLTMVLADGGIEVVESLIDASNTSSLRQAIQGVGNGEIDLVETLGNYLQLGMQGIEKAMGHNEMGWNQALTEALKFVQGCYAAQAQALERIQPQVDATNTELVFDPDYDVWELKLSELSMMIDNVNGVETGEPVVKVGDRVSSPYVNVGFSYKVTEKTSTNVKLKAIRD